MKLSPCYWLKILCAEGEHLILLVIYFYIRLSHEATNYKNLRGLVYPYTLYAVGTLHVVFGILGYLLKT